LAGLLLLAAALPLAVRGAENRVIPVGGLTALPGAESPGPNLVKNPNFEAPAGDLAGWSARVGGPWSIDRGGRGGRPALRLTGAEAQSGGPQLEQTVTLEPGRATVGGGVKAAPPGTKDPRHARHALRGPAPGRARRRRRAPGRPREAGAAGGGRRRGGARARGDRARNRGARRRGAARQRLAAARRAARRGRRRHVALSRPPHR